MQLLIHACHVDYKAVSRDWVPVIDPSSVRLHQHWISPLSVAITDASLGIIWQGTMNEPFNGTAQVPEAL